MRTPLFLQLVVMMFVRWCLNAVFSRTELRILDDILPEFKRHERLSDEEIAMEVEEEYEKDLASRRQSLR